MKMKTPLVAAMLLTVVSSVQAFTLDAVGYEGGVLEQNPFSIFVPGYGEIVLEAALGSSLVVNSAYETERGFGAPTLSFDPAESVKITFNGAEPQNVRFVFVGLSVGESFVIERDLFTPQALNVTLQGRGEGNGAGIYAMGWTVVPEPASATLALLGSMLLVLRRRR
jgi:hypothetical protein